MNKYFVETNFSHGIYQAENFEILEGGVLHLYDTEEEEQVQTKYLFSPPYDFKKK